MSELYKGKGKNKRFAVRYDNFIKKKIDSICEVLDSWIKMSNARTPEVIDFVLILLHNICSPEPTGSVVTYGYGAYSTGQ